jgi:hypothetical protein
MTLRQGKSASRADTAKSALPWERPTLSILLATSAESGGGPQIDNNGLS